MANEHNLIPAQKGEVRNPKGRGKGVPNSKTRLLKLLELVTKVRNPVTGEEEEFSIAEQLDMKMIAKALKGDTKAYEIVIDRLEGKPKQTTDINADVKGNIQIIIEPDAGCEPIKY
jgi:hypothetical protein